MAKGSDRNYVSFWFWLLAIIVMAIPCIGLVMMFVWAFTGENESRKNFFRAQIALIAVGVAVVVVLLLIGSWPEANKQIEIWMHHHGEAK